MKKIAILIKSSLILFSLSIFTFESYAQLAWGIDSISVSPQVAVNTNIPIKVYGKMFSNTHGDCDSTLSIIGDTIFIGVNFRESCTPVNNFSWSSFANLSLLQPGIYYIKVTAKAYSNSAPTPGIRVKVKSFQVGSISGLNNKKMPDINAPQISLYPNPAAKNFSIRFSNPKSQPHQVTIINSIGQVVKTTNEIKTEEIKIEKGNLPPGVYFYRLLQNEKLIHTGKLILQ